MRSSWAGSKDISPLLITDWAGNLGKPYNSGTIGQQSSGAVVWIVIILVIVIVLIIVAILIKIIDYLAIAVVVLIVIPVVVVVVVTAVIILKLYWTICSIENTNMHIIYQNNHKQLTPNQLTKTNTPFNDRIKLILYSAFLNIYPVICICSSRFDSFPLVVINAASRA